MEHCKVAVLVRLKDKTSSHFSDTEEMACQSSTSQVPYPSQTHTWERVQYSNLFFSRHCGKSLNVMMWPGEALIHGKLLFP